MTLQYDMAKIKKKETETKFKSFHETYSMCAFALAIGLMYPNSENRRKRLIYMIIFTTANVPQLYWLTINTLQTLKDSDFYNFSRHITISVVVLLFLFKTVYAIIMCDMYKKLLNQITDDMNKGNELDDSYKAIYKQYIKEAKFGQICWVFIPIAMSFQFPAYAAICTIYESIISDVGPKCMIHNLDLSFMGDQYNISPYFEIMFVYNAIQTIALVPNFTGFDGSFCIVTSHLRLNLKLLSHKLKRIFEDSKSNLELRKNIKTCVIEHQEILRFYDAIQVFYAPWLMTVFLLTSVLISFNLYRMHLDQKIDLKYSFFALSGVIHMLAPCYFSSKLIEAGEEVAIEMYSVKWQRWNDNKVTKVLIFMIARAQKEFVLVGAGIILFNMNLFLSLMRTSYSVFTLLCTR
uniref:Odorant receptor n=1 Tax=Histia rhodope TaxID=1453155 RepID=A0A7G4KBW5_9NEOP|nr:odorant receptor [Histia rhodope]